MSKRYLINFGIYALIWSLLTSFLFFYFEKDNNSNIHSWYDSLWWTIVTFTTVGYGDISPQTLAGKIIASLTMIIGIGFLSNFIATIISMISENQKKRDSGMKTINLKNHLIICGYHPFKTLRFINEFQFNKKFAKTQIVLISPSVESNPFPDRQNITFVKGYSTDEETLIQAGVLQCNKATVMAESFENHKVDDQIILTVLLIKELNPKVYVTAEVSSSIKKNLLKKAHCDEIITLSALSINLMVQSMQDPGTTQIIEELITNTYGQHLHKNYLPHDFKPQSFFEFSQYSLNQGKLVIAIQNHQKILINPSPNLIIQPNHTYFFISS